MASLCRGLGLSRPVRLVLPVAARQSFYQSFYRVALPHDHQVLLQQHQQHQQQQRHAFSTGPALLGKPKASPYARPLNGKPPRVPPSLPKSGKTKTPVSKTSTEKSPPLPQSPQHSYARQLGARSAPTLLYEAAPSGPFRALTMAVGAGAVVYTVTNYWTIFLDPPPGLAPWVTHAFGGVCLLMAAFATYMFRGTHGLVQRIRAVPPQCLAQCGPSATKQVAALAALSTKATNAPAPPVLYLELQIARMVPGFAPRCRYVPAPGGLAAPSLVRLGSALTSPVDAFGAPPPRTYNEMTLEERVLARRADKARWEAVRQYEMDHLLSAPFRHAGQGASTAWKLVQRSLSHEGFAQVRETHSGRKHRLDLVGGWALDNGRALDRLVEPSSP